MSHSPLEATTSSGKAEYRRQWNALVRMMREGRSFSGRERNCCFLNTGGQPFADVSAASGLDFAEDARAVLPIDWDFDGRMDLWLVNRTAPRLRFLRNRSATSNHYVSVRLTGRRCNRDAIGARVEVGLAENGEQPLVKTLHAGEGFVSQSSKTLHFGLGGATRIQRLTVRWPDGDVQQFADLATDVHYQITQDDDAPVRWTPPAGPTRLKPSDLQPLAREGTVRMALARQVPMPPIAYKDARGRTTAVAHDGKQATLINLWATWCRPCLGELKEFAEHEEEIRNSPVRIIALDVDGLRDSTGPAGDAAEGILDRLAFPFERGYATDSLLSRLEFIQRQLAPGRQSLSLPMSFLVGPDGSLAVVFRGPVSVGRLLADAKQLTALETASGSFGVMFPGRWYERPTYLEFLERLGEGFFAGGNYQAAARYYRAALETDPDVQLAQQGLNKARVKLALIAQAVEKYSAMVRAQPNNAEAHWQLGLALQTQGDGEQAIYHLQRAVQIDPESVRAHNDLGAAYASQGEFDKAEQQFNKALQIDPKDPSAKINLERLRANRTANPQAPATP